MSIGEEALRALLAAHAGPAAARLRLAPDAPEGREQRFIASDGQHGLDIHLYPASEREVARREDAGLRLGGAMGLGPELVYAGEARGEAGLEPGAWIIIARRSQGEALGGRPLTEAELDDWLFLLLTLHHLRPAMASQPSSMSADLGAWWARAQPDWGVCRQAYAAAPYAPLMRGLSQLHAITQVRIETNRPLWEGVERRPCHGNPAPGHLVKAGGRLTLTEWSGFGLGDPAIETARVGALATLAGELSSQQYTRFIAAYLDGMRDLRDATLEERLRVFASVAPMGFTLNALAALARPGVITPRARGSVVGQIVRALTWSLNTMGVEIGDPATLLAPVR